MTVLPTPPVPEVTVPDLSTVSAPVGVTGRVKALVCVRRAPLGGSAVAVAVLATEPASTSDCLSV